jgi:hypothetical protein
MDAREELKPPTRGRLYGSGSKLSGKRLSVLHEYLPDTVLRSTVDQETEDHNHHQYHNESFQGKLLRYDVYLKD